MITDDDVLPAGPPWQRVPLVLPSSVELSGERLVYRHGEPWRAAKPRRGERPGAEFRPGVGLLPSFIELHSKDGEAIRSFAARYGVLRICEHGVPGSHKFDALDLLPCPSRQTEESWQRIKEDTTRWRAPAGWRKADGSPADVVQRVVGEDAAAVDVPVAEYWEPIAAWRLYSREAEAIIRLAKALQEGQAGSVTDWQALGEAADRRAPRPEARWGILNRAVNRWLALGGIRLGFQMHQDWSRISVVGGALFGVLALQLAVSLNPNLLRGFAFCDVCQELYLLGERQRRPKEGQLNYCVRCRTSPEGKQAINRIRSATWRRKHPGYMNEYRKRKGEESK